jgi:DNA-binding NarL/FixJ family response regulator
VGDAYYQQGEIHRLRGEFDAAEKSYQEANRFGREPQPGLAVLRLKQGNQEAATKTIRRLLGGSTDRLKRASFLPAFVEILLADGAIDEADQACQELQEIADTYGTDVLQAMSAHARGAVSLARGDAREALEPLRKAFQVWQHVGAPYIAARIRVLLARACTALGDQDGAQLELEAARQVFERLGASPDLAALDASRQDKSADQRHRLTPRELEVLRLVASGKTNKAIASELFLSERTIDRHVSNIFSKLNVSSRASATAFAYKHQLV